MGYPSRKIDDQLKNAQVAINNTLTDPHLQTALARYGMTAERLQEGQRLHSRALNLHQQQRIAYSDLTAAKDALVSAQGRAQAQYMHYVKVARTALETNRAALQRLDLAVQRKQALTGWISQAQQFYDNALSDPHILDHLSGYGLTQAKLEAGKELVDVVDGQYEAQRSRQGEAREATRVRDAALADLAAWMTEFRQVARLALQRQPKYVEKLGMTARS